MRSTAGAEKVLQNSYPRPVLHVDVEDTLEQARPTYAVGPGLMITKNDGGVVGL